MEYIKIGNYVVPNSKIRADGYSFNDSEICFETPALTNDKDYSELIKEIKANCDEKNFAIVTAYDSERDGHVTEKCLFVEPNPKVYGVHSGETWYKSIRFTFERTAKGRYEGGVRMEENTELLNTLKSIDVTLKHIEQSLEAEKQHEAIKEAVSHAMSGEKFNPTCGDDKGNVRSLNGKTTANI